MQSLKEVLKYENNEVVLRFAKDNELSLEDAQDVFLETKRWLWLCASSQKGPVNMVSEAFVIDEMWHTFLLFTRDYSDFCQSYFFQFVHHVPKKFSDPEQTDWRESLRKDYEFIYDKLGPEVLIKWSKIYPQKFNGLRPK